ncbi:MAG: hypothetical protein ACLP8S_12165 [Solirubrobacteraceae bacterium]
MDRGVPSGLDPRLLPGLALDPSAAVDSCWHGWRWSEHMKPLVGDAAEADVHRWSTAGQERLQLARDWSFARQDSRQ